MARRAIGGLAGVLLFALAGCAGAPDAGPLLAPERPMPSVSTPQSPVPSTTPSTSATPSQSPPASAVPSFGAAYPVACAGYPAASTVVALVRSGHVISRTARVTVTLGPMCAGGWQYTVLSLAGREPLQVVTRGTPAALTLVTAGTDVCTPLVRTQAPPGILSLTHC